MNLQDVNVGTQAFDALVNRVDDMLPTQSNLVDQILAVIGRHGPNARLATVRRDAKIALRQNDQLLPGNVVLLDGLADDLFRDTVGIDVSGVPSVESDFVGVLQDGQGRLFVEDPILPFW